MYIISEVGAFNLGGRFLYGVLSDKIGRKLCFLFTLLSQFIILLSMWAILEARNYPAFLFCIWFLASCYGSSFGLIPAFLADMFGAKNVGVGYSTCSDCYINLGMSRNYTDLMVYRRRGWGFGLHSHIQSCYFTWLHDSRHVSLCH